MHRGRQKSVSPLRRLRWSKIKIIIHPHSGWYFSFGHSPNTTGYAQVRLYIGLSAMHLLRNPAQAGLKPSLPCVKGGGTACRDGGIVKSNSYTKTIPQPPSASAPFTQGSLFMFIYTLSFFLTSTAFVDTKAKYGISLSRYTVFLQNCPLG